MTTLYADSANVPYRAENAPLAGRTRDRQLRFGVFKYTFTGDEVADDEIEFPLELEAGSMVFTHLGRVLTLVTAATALTLNIGDDDGAGDEDRYATLLDVATAADDVPFDAHPAYTLTERSKIYATLKTVTTPVEGGELLFIVPYLCQ